MSEVGETWSLKLDWSIYRNSTWSELKGNRNTETTNHWIRIYQDQRQS